MTTRAITLLLLSFAFNKALCTPVPQCTSGSSVPSQTPEVYSQNNGQPLVVYAYNNGANELTASAPAAELGAASIAPISTSLPATSLTSSSSCVSSGVSSSGSLVSSGAPTVGPSTGLVPPSASVPSSAPVAPTTTDLQQAQALADETEQCFSSQLNDIPPQSEQPCKVETSTEIVQTPGETFVHQPGEILISQPPTRLVINHAPYIVRPAPIILNQGGKTITNAYTRKYMPAPVQLRPVIVRIVKPIEKRVFIDKDSGPGSASYIQSPPVPSPCESALAYAPIGFPSSSLPSSGYPLSGLPASSLPALSLPASSLPALSLPASSLPASSLPALSLPSSALSGYGLSDSSLGLVGSSLPAPLPLSSATAADTSSYASLLSASGIPLSETSPIELQSTGGSYLSAPPSAAACGCV